MIKEKDIINEIKYLYTCEMNSKDLEKREIKYLREIYRLHSIIKEVREYIRNNSEKFDGDLCIGDYFELKDIIEILDKENEDGKNNNL